MVYYVYLDPAVITEAKQIGVIGLVHLLSILESLAENCCLVEFDDWRVTSELGRVLAQHDDSTESGDNIKKIKAWLGRMKKENRFVSAITAPDAPGTDLDIALHSQAEAQIDAFIVPSAVFNSSHSSQHTLLTFNGSSFNQERRKHANHGVIYQGGEMQSADFYHANLLKALRHAASIQFLDSVLVPRYDNHWRHTSQTIVRHFEASCHEWAAKEIEIHSEMPDKPGRLEYCRLDIQHPKATTPLKIIAYEKGALPHERYLLTDQFAFEIGRGLDFLDSSTDRNRDVSISFKDPKSIDRLLQAAAPHRLPD